MSLSSWSLLTFLCIISICFHQHLDAYYCHVPILLIENLKCLAIKTHLKSMRLKE